MSFLNVGMGNFSELPVQMGSLVELLHMRVLGKSNSIFSPFSLTLQNPSLPSPRLLKLIYPLSKVIPSSYAFQKLCAKRFSLRKEFSYELDTRPVGNESFDSLSARMKEDGVDQTWNNAKKKVKTVQPAPKILFVFKWFYVTMPVKYKKGKYTK
ncbi:hypothetical protein NE237_003936 [Protea cynaroides]|uniref:Uncharacterized protein n=1 Tax=Protea cynaroides TaxID=273540 RepID=A0A9Q0KHW1_9MAGN|nr:hypothetical protein NE237_003936 [Protea cynaroides]